MIPEKMKDISYLVTLPEGQYFDRKSARKKPLELLQYIVSFANAGGGILAIGIEDDGTVTGFKDQMAKPIEEFKNVAFIKLTETPVICDSFELNVKNYKGEDDIVLLLSIEPSNTRVIKNYDGYVYLRFGDQSPRLSFEQIKQLQYDKGESWFEDEEVITSSLDDIDPEQIEAYKKTMGANSSDTAEDVLKARNMLINGHLTNAGILLFAKNPTKYLPQARLRFIRYDGTSAKVGTELNIVKEQTFDGSIPDIIQKAKTFISTQFREFQFLESDGVFRKMPEYPEFAWTEGIVNALTHRNYSIRGNHITVIMYDDRLEIKSPGKLPNIVTLENMKEERYSRNPKIARILSEFGWVKELNEGVKRIYSEMQQSFLHDPIYSEPGDNVLLILENNILNRTVRRFDAIQSIIGKDKFRKLSADELTLLQYAFNAGRIDTKTAIRITGKSTVYVRERLKKLEALGLLTWNGSNKNDPTQYYSFLNK